MPYPVLFFPISQTNALERHGLMLPGFLALAATIASCSLVVATNLVLVYGQALETNGAASVNLVGADANLCTETVAHAIGETSRCVPVGTGRVDLVHEALSLFLVRSHDAVCVVRAVLVNVCDGGLGGGHRLDGKCEGEVLRVKVGVGSILDLWQVERGDGCLASSVASQFDALFGERGCHGGEHGLQR